MEWITDGGLKLASETVYPKYAYPRSNFLLDVVLLFLLYALD